MIPPEVAKLLQELGGESLLKHALAADNKAEADTQTLDAAGIASKAMGSANKANAEELVDRLNALFQLADDLKLRRDFVAALVKDMGIDKAERALLILADGTADTLKSRRAHKPSLIETVTKVHPVSGSYLDRLLKEGK